MKEIRKYFKKLKKRIYKSTFSILIISMFGLVVFILEDYVYADTEIQIENISFQFHHHEIFLREKLINIVEEMVSSEHFSNINKITHKKISLNDRKLYSDMHEHQKFLSKLMRIMNYYDLLVQRIFVEIIEVSKYSLMKLDKEKQKSFISDFENLEKLSEKFDECIKKIQTKKKATKYFLTLRPETMTPEMEAEVILKIVTFFKDLYTDDCFLISMDGSSSKSIDEYANSVIKMLDYYLFFLQMHKDEISRQNTFKKIWTLVLLLLTSVLIFNKELKEKNNL